MSKNISQASMPKRCTFPPLSDLQNRDSISPDLGSFLTFWILSARTIPVQVTQGIQGNIMRRHCGTWEEVVSIQSRQHLLLHFLPECLQICKSFMVQLTIFRISFVSFCSLSKNSSKLSVSDSHAQPIGSIEMSDLLLQWFYSVQCTDTTEIFTHCGSSDSTRTNTQKPIYSHTSLV